MPAASGPNRYSRAVAAHGRPTVAPGNLIAAKAALYLAMRQEDVRPAELARRMNVEQPSVKPAARSHMPAGQRSSTRLCR
ncbi:MAG: hypothetical protein U1E35_01940 [Rhodospirillales bacterium]